MTFYALSSGPGLSGIAVIRVSGSETVNVIKHLTNSSLPKPKEATLKKFINKNNELIDEGILLWFPGPNSYTGEDMAEFHVHGSRAVIEAIHKVQFQKYLIVDLHLQESSRRLLFRMEK